MKHNDHLLPKHTADEEKTLRDDIEANGLQVPVVVDEHGDIIDGLLRAKICKELNLDWLENADVRPGLNDDQKAALRIQLNLLRRHTPPSQQQRSQYVNYLLIDSPESSDQVIAEFAGVSRSKVQRDRSQLAQMGKLPPVTHTIGRDRKRRIKRRRQTKFTVKNSKEHGDLRDALNVLSEHGEILPKGRASTKFKINRAGRIQTANKIRGAKLSATSDNVVLRHSDFRNLVVEPESVDLILTDVLWKNGVKDDWRELGRRTAKWLKPDGVFATLIGTLHLDKALAVFRQHLHYRWKIELLFDPKAHVIEHSVNVRSRSRPVLVFTRDPKRKFHGFADLIEGHLKEKDYHKYQQPVSSFTKLVECLSDPGALVADPCMGTGTTGLACMKAAGGPRRFVGCDVSKEMFDIARYRILEEVKEGKPKKCA